MGRFKKYKKRNMFNKYAKFNRNRFGKLSNTNMTKKAIGYRY